LILNATEYTTSENIPITTITFTRKLITGDHRDMDIADRSIYLLWSEKLFKNLGPFDYFKARRSNIRFRAYANHDPDATTLQYTVHSYKGLVEVNLLKGQLDDDVSIDKSSPHTSYRTAHAQLMIAGWILSITAGNFDAR